jgi:hypothetical protein
VFDLTAPTGSDRAKVELKLVSRHPMLPDLGGVVLFSDEIPIREGA